MPVHVGELITEVEVTGEGSAAPAPARRPVPPWEELERVRRATEALRRERARTAVEDVDA